MSTAPFFYTVLSGSSILPLLALSAPHHLCHPSCLIMSWVSLRCSSTFQFILTFSSSFQAVRERTESLKSEKSIFKVQQRPVSIIAL